MANKKKKKKTQHNKHRLLGSEIHKQSNIILSFEG